MLVTEGGYASAPPASGLERYPWSAGRHLTRLPTAKSDFKAA
jgi:hypothetical protein